MDDLTRQVINAGIIISFNQGVEASIEFCRRHPHLPAHAVCTALESLLRDTREQEVAGAKAESDAMLTAFITEATAPWFEIPSPTPTE